MCYYYKHIYNRDDRYDEFNERLARQLEYERQHPNTFHSSGRGEQTFRVEDEMPF